MRLSGVVIILVRPNLVNRQKSTANRFPEKVKSNRRALEEISLDTHQTRSRDAESGLRSKRTYPQLTSKLPGTRTTSSMLATPATRKRAVPVALRPSS